ncbi:hypothetical protein MRX96_044269 [Rhipicephalus microplus]
MFEHASTPALVVQAARPPQLPRRRPMPRLPSEHYKIVVRPRHPINLSNIGLATPIEAIQNTAKVDPAQVEKEDQIIIHPIKNTLTVSTPDRIRAESYRSLEVLRSQRYNKNLPVATYVPAPDDSIRGVVYKAYTDETDHDLQAQLVKKNPDIPIVNARRVGSSNHLVITFAGHKLPATIRFRCFTLEVLPFRERPEAYFNCRKLGHRTDVCLLPHPGIPKCRRCAGEDPPPPLGEQPTCTPQCVVSLGEHPTGSRSCKLRFTPVKPNNSKKTSMSSRTIEGRRSKSAGRRSRSRSRKRSKSRNRKSSISVQKSCSPSEKTSASMPAIHNNKNAWSNGPPKSVGWSTDDPGQTSKGATTQPASNTKQGGQDQEPVHPGLEAAIPDPVRDQGRSHR